MSSGHHYLDNEGMTLTSDMVAEGLKTLGIHPLALRHSFLELCLAGQFINNLDLLIQYPLVMYLNVSNNRLQSLVDLQHLTALVTLNAK
jgi:hypothetical protein